MTKLHKDELRKSFRPAVKIQSLAAMTRSDPNYIYKGVRYDEFLDPDGDRIDRYLENGWEIVSSTEKLLDERTSGSKSKDEESLRQKPVTKVGKKGAQFVFMRISKEQHAENQKAKVKRNEDRHLASTKNKISRSGNEVRITGPEANENNSNSEVDNNG